MNFFRSRFFVACVASTVTALVVGGIAWAAQSPVDSSGVVRACYNATNGNMHLNVTGSCPAKGQNTPITWGVTGPQGVPGPADVDTLTLSASGVNGGDGFISDFVGYGQECNSTSTTQPSDAGCHQLFAVGVKIRLTAAFDSSDGSTFDHWTGACAGATTNVCDITMDSDESVGVVFTG